MGQAIGQILPFAVGVGLSPIPIIAVVLMLSTPRARANGPAFLVGWVLGLSAVGAVVFLISSWADPTDDSGGPATWQSTLKLVLGLLLLLFALKQWRGRPHGEAEPAEPKWMGAVDSFAPGKAAGAGAVLSAANPKNLVLAIGTAAAIAETEISIGQEIVAYAVFVLIGTIGVAAPVVIYFALGERAKPLLDGLHTWMARNNAVIMAVLFLVIGARLVGDAISGFSS
jgi:threonine/homoserine/homoserine lactone efflux protein